MHVHSFFFVLEGLRDFDTGRCGMHAGKEWPLSLSGLPASVAFGQQHPRSSVPGVPGLWKETDTGVQDTTMEHAYMSHFQMLVFFSFSFERWLPDALFSWWHIYMFFLRNNPSGQFGGLEVSNITLTRRWLASYRCAAKTKCSKTLAFVCTFLFCFLALYCKE